jgi:DNA-binding response OmpR family regulator
MTGDKLVRQILEIRPDTPIILSTGFSEKINEKQAKKIGVADYIEKPFISRELAFKVRQVLDEK